VWKVRCGEVEVQRGGGDEAAVDLTAHGLIKRVRPREPLEMQSRSQGVRPREKAYRLVESTSVNNRGREDKSFSEAMYESDSAADVYDTKMEMGHDTDDDIVLLTEEYGLTPPRSTSRLDRSGERTLDYKIERHRAGEDRDERSSERADRRVGGRSGSCTERPDKSSADRERRESDRIKDDKDYIPRERRPPAAGSSSPKVASPYRTSGGERSRAGRSGEEREGVRTDRSDRERDREREKEPPREPRKRREKSSDRERSDRSRERDREKPPGAKLNRVGSSYTIREGGQTEEKESVEQKCGGSLILPETRPRAERPLSGMRERSLRDDRERRDREDDFIKRRRGETPYWELLLAVDSLWHQDDELEIDGEEIPGIAGKATRSRSLPSLGSSVGIIGMPKSMLGKYLMIRWTMRPLPATS
jgi:hypothetical protein